MQLWRLTRAEHAPGLDGEGARLHGGQWNSPGLPMVYAASSLALAVLEVFVHLPPALRRQGGPPPLVAVALDLADGDLGEIDVTSLPQKYGIPDCQALGEAWLLSSAGVAARVPSQVIAQEWNIVLNPRHSAIGRVTVAAVTPFRFDPRLGGRS